MKLSVMAATEADASPIAALRTAVGERLTRDFGRGHWSSVVMEKGVLRRIKTSRVLVARDAGSIVATLRLATKNRGRPPHRPQTEPGGSQAPSPRARAAAAAADAPRTAGRSWTCNHYPNPYPLPPIPEQHEIVRRVDALLKLAEAIEKRVAAATVRADKLTQAILARAFRGELVPTEAELARREGRDYEPASVLLERIRTEREGPGSQLSGTRRRGPSCSQAI